MIPLEQIRAAADRIQATVLKTPLIYAPSLSRMFGGNVFLKLENLQKTGSFKIRGATNKISLIADTIGSAGVVAASAGNHAQGVALAAKQLGIPATIVMPQWVSISKQEATRAYGGDIIIAGRSIGESLEKARELAQQGKTFVHPFDDEEIISGQGTAGLEIFADLPDPDTIVVPVGGGGFISGIASVAKALRPQTKIIGVQTARFPSAYQSVQKGVIVQVASASSVADGISVKEVGRLPYHIIKKHVDELVLVEEEQIAAAILMLLERKKILAEGAGAAPLAALLNGTVVAPPKSTTVLVISGGNVDSPLLGRILSKGLIEHGRVMRLRVRLADVPGSLAKLLAQVAKLKANVLHIYHDRSIRDVPIYVTHVELELETRGQEHVRQVADALVKAGYEISLRQATV
jgi:threonine dehydratase